MTHLKMLEIHAANIYTRNMFKTVKSEIAKEIFFFVNDKQDQMGRRIYTVCRSKKLESKWILIFDLAKETF